jgi:lipoprotein-anchoring transpeptidase ErfK/SrfK
MANASGKQSATMAKAQVLLDRAGFSVGAIDGLAGENTVRAISAFEQARGIPADGRLTPTVWQALTQDTVPAITEYTIQREDVAGPFLPSIPKSLDDMAKLPYLAYTSPLELLAEKFHMSRDFLRQLNQGADFSKAGTKLSVTSVRSGKPNEKVARVEVDKARETVTAFDRDGKMIRYYPATVGSESLPSPTGLRKVRAIANDPKYYYRPNIGIAGGPKHNLVIAAGPNNPVGNIWIDLDEPGYGLHGTADPETIGKASSHRRADLNHLRQFLRIPVGQPHAAV